MNTVSNHPAEDEDAVVLLENMERQLKAQAGDDAYWSEVHSTRPYVNAGEAYRDYEPAYVYGVVWYHSYPERQFDEWEGDLANGWDSARGGSPLDWPKAKPAVREAWYRVSDLAARAKLERSEVLSKSPTAQTPGDR